MFHGTVVNIVTKQKRILQWIVYPDDAPDALLRNNLCHLRMCVKFN